MTISQRHRKSFGKENIRCIDTKIVTDFDAVVKDFK